MGTTADFKNGLCIKYNNDLWKIESFQHVKPGKGPAFVRTKIRNLKTSRILENTFTAGVKIEIVRIENRNYQFLYKEGDDTFHFMNQKNYEQVALQKDIINAPAYLKEGSSVDIMFHAENETPLSCSLPANVNLEITFTEPGEKGNTATNALKPATTETGVEVKVPLFINQGDIVKIDTSSGNYIERVKQ
ncbi:MAG: elongation factor P [Flavobacteriales bacterium]|jgi:elongation factor P|nr:elongation factor P [Flavobacteriales bacterium]|tara:strand:+ start:129 stop:698 length:570 start_codon:yes stop_codon:yes gene_type:complete